MRVAVLGMGNMGQAFAARALERGYEVAIWNRSQRPLDHLTATGAALALDTQSAVHDADVILVVVADDAAVRAVCLGDRGVLATRRTSSIVVCVSTVSPETVRSLAAEAGDDLVVDAPVLGAPEMIANGSGHFLVGGSPEIVERLAPLLSDLGAGATTCGPVGSGATMKLIINHLLITGVAAVAEGIATARNLGLGDDLIREVLHNSPVVSLASAVRLDSLLDDGHPGWFSPELARKDLRLSIEQSTAAHVDVRIGPAVEQLLSAVIDTGASWPDFTAVIEGLEGAQ